VTLQLTVTPFDCGTSGPIWTTLGSGSKPYAGKEERTYQNVDGNVV